MNIFIICLIVITAIYNVLFYLSAISFSSYLAVLVGAFGVFTPVGIGTLSGSLLVVTGFTGDDVAISDNYLLNLLSLLLLVGFILLIIKYIPILFEHYHLPTLVQVLVSVAICFSLTQITDYVVFGKFNSLVFLKKSFQEMSSEHQGSFSSTNEPLTVESASILIHSLEKNRSVEEIASLISGEVAFETSGLDYYQRYYQFKDGKLFIHQVLESGDIDSVTRPVNIEDYHRLYTSFVNKNGNFSEDFSLHYLKPEENDGGEFLLTYAFVIDTNAHSLSSFRRISNNLYERTKELKKAFDKRPRT